MNLPEDVYQRIFSFLNDGKTVKHGHNNYTTYYHLQKPTHSSAALANKQFQRLVTPFLYKSHRIIDVDKPFRLLLRTLGERPDLARMVREVDITCWTVGMADESHQTQPDHGMLAIVDSTNLPDPIWKERFREDVRSAKQDALIALLLLLCTELTVCKLEIPYEFHLSHVQRLCILSLSWHPTEGNGSKTPFHQLRYLTLENADDEGTCTYDLTPYLRLPSLKRFLGVAINFTKSFLLPFDVSSLSNVKYMVLEGSLVDAYGFEWILKLCPHLKTLEVGWGSSTAGVSEIDNSAIGVALNSYGQNLTRLNLDASKAFELDEQEFNTLSTISDMTALKSLTVGSDLLIYSDDDVAPDSDEESVFSSSIPSTLPLTTVLPRSLRILRIMRCNEDDAEELEKRISELLLDNTFTSLATIALNISASILQDILPNGWVARTVGEYWLRIERYV